MSLCAFLEHVQQHTTTCLLGNPILKGKDEQKSEEKQLKQSRGDLKVSQLYTFGQSGQNVFHYLAWVPAGNCVPEKCSQVQHVCTQKVLKQFGLTHAGVDEIKRVYEFIKADKPLALEAMLNAQESGQLTGLFFI